MQARFRDQLEKTTSEWFAGWKAGTAEPERRAPVFLVGFPRSGTTLLDTILMGHPDTVVMEERPVINRLEAEIGGFDVSALESGQSGTPAGQPALAWRQSLIAEDGKLPTLEQVADPAVLGLVHLALDELKCTPASQ